MGAQERRIGTWCSWGVVLLSWIGLFLVLALMFKANGCNPSSGARTPADDGAWTASSNARDIPTGILQSDPADEGYKNGPTPAEIRERAFEIHMERGGIHGCDLDDWLQAEHELKAKYNKTSDPGTKKK